MAVESSLENSGRCAGLTQSLLLLLGSCLPVLGAVLLAPVLPRMQAHFADVAGSTVLVPIVLTLPALMIAVLAPFAGVIVDRLGRKPLLLASMALYTLCGVLPLWLDSLQAIVASRAGIGLAEAGIMTCCTTLMGDYYSGARRERLFALQMVATSLSAAVFIALGGFLGQDDWRTPFALYAVGLGMSNAALYRRIRVLAIDEADKINMRSDWTRAAWQELMDDRYRSGLSGATCTLLITQTDPESCMPGDVASRMMDGRFARQWPQKPNRFTEERGGELWVPGIVHVDGQDMRPYMRKAE